MGHGPSKYRILLAWPATQPRSFVMDGRHLRWQNKANVAMGEGGPCLGPHLFNRHERDDKS